MNYHDVEVELAKLHICESELIIKARNLENQSHELNKRANDLREQAKQVSEQRAKLWKEID